MEQYRKKRRRRRRKKHIFGKILLGLFLVLAVLVLAAGEESRSFTQLEELLDDIELRETGFRYAYDHSGQNFSVQALAYG